MFHSSVAAGFCKGVYQKNKLFAIEEIRTKYPGYTEVLLHADLLKKKSKMRKKKHKPVVDLRRCQLEKQARKLNGKDLNEQDYQIICCRIVLLRNAHNLRLPIPLTVTLKKHTLVYSFNWRARETVVKSFVDLANSQGMTHELLGLRYKKMTGYYSF